MNQYSIGLFAALTACTNPTPTAPVGDAGVTVDSARPGDSSISRLDARSEDASSGADAGPADSSTEQIDSGPVAFDSGIPTDGGSGASDAGTPTDGGLPSADAADADGSPTDGGVEAVALCGDVDGMRVESATVAAACPVTLSAGLVVTGSLVGEPGSIIYIAEGAPGVALAAGASVTGVTIISAGSFGLAVFDADGAIIADTTVEAQRGVALYLTGSSDATLSGVTLTGPITSLNASDPRWIDTQGAPTEVAACVGCTCTPGDRDPAMNRVCSSTGNWVTWTAVAGLYGIDSAVELSGVTVSGFAGYGVALRSSTAVGTDLEVRDTAGVGIRLESSSSLSVADSLVQNVFERGHVGVGVLVDRSELNLDGTRVVLNGVGILSDGGAIEVDGGALSQNLLGLFTRNGTTVVANASVTPSASA